MVFILAIEIKDVLRIIDITDFFSRALRERKIGKILELLQLLASSGVISNEELTELSIELMELLKLEGEELEERIEELERKIKVLVIDRSIKSSEEAILSKLHSRIEFLASSGVISNNELLKLSIELMELSKLEGEEFKEKAKEIEKRIEKYVRGNRRALHR